MSKHTPGPWRPRFDTEWPQVETTTGLSICEVRRAADAYVLSAAPDLLAALIEATHERRCSKGVRMEGDCLQAGDEKPCRICRARAVIAKATGD